MSENKWPAWVWLDDSTSYDYDTRCEWGVWNEPVSDLVEPVTEVYIHRDAARAWAGLAMWCMCGDGGKYAAALHQNLTDRAWQALRDWLNATKEYEA